MNEEKKNLTDEERKELKEGLKKEIDELSDEELNEVAGGVETESGEVTCGYCGEKFIISGVLSKVKYWSHCQAHTQNPVLCVNCDICGQPFPTNYMLNNHKKEVHNI